MAYLHTSSSLDYSEPHSYSLRREETCLNSQPSLPSIPSLPSLPRQHVQNTQHCCITTLKGHNTYVSSIAIGGKFLYTGSSNKEIRLWKRSSLNTELGHENTSDKVAIAGNGAVKSLVASADKIFSAHQDHKIRVWKIDNDEKLVHLATLPTLGDRALRFLMPKNHVRVRRHKKSTWVHHVDTVSALALSRDESVLYSVSWDRTLKIWRTTDFKCLESVANAHDDAINAVALSCAGVVYTGSADKKIKIWRRKSEDENHSQVATLEKHNSGINALALSSDETVLYSGASDRSILVWEKDGDDNMVVVGALRGHAKSILCLAVVSDFLCSGSADKTIRFWRRRGKCHSCLAILEGHEGPVKCLAVTSSLYNPYDMSSSYIIYGGDLARDIKVWQISTPQF